MPPTHADDDDDDDDDGDGISPATELYCPLNYWSTQVLEINSCMI